MYKSRSGFTIVELLIVIVVIGILAAIVIVAYTGVQQKADNARRVSDIQTVAKAVRMYYVENGHYPITGSSTSNVLSDSKCSVGTKQADWVPDVTPAFIGSLPQSDGKQPNGINTGCYKYWSNGASFVLSAWIASATDTTNSGFYHRAGFREAINGPADMYYCNHASMGGMNGGAGPYKLSNDLYKKSYTIVSEPLSRSASDTTPCNETPPTGA